jgi:nucleotide-binding universal stress UspA family protein
MVESVFHRVVVPVANPDDAVASASALHPFVADGESTVIAVHVIEKAGGAPDKASVEQREQYAEDVFSSFTEEFEEIDVTLETDLRYGTDVATTIIDVAHERNVTAIVFTPRGGSRWQKLLTGNVTHHLVESTDIPVIVLPDREVTKE